MMPRERIVIVGGGFTGLVAAWELARREAGLEVTVVERAPVLGGLVAGFEVCGTSLEKTYHYLFLTDSAILGLADELGVLNRVVWCRSTVGVYLGGRIYPFATPWDLLRFTPCSLAGRVRLGLAILYLQRRKDWRQLAGITGHRWLARACGASAMRTVWDPLLKGKFDRYGSEVSMAWLWARIHGRANSRADGGEKLGYFRGGFAVVTGRLEEELRRAGVQVWTGAKVEALELGAGQRGVRVKGRSLPFDRCLFTGPSYALARLLPAGSVDEGYRRRLESVVYLGAVCLVFVSEQSLSQQCWINIHEAGAPFLLFIQHSLLVGTEGYQGRHVYYLGGYLPQDSPVLQEEEGSVAGRWFAYLGRMFPEFDPGRVTERHLFRFDAAQQVVDTTYEARIPDYRTPVAGVYLANFSQIFPEDRGTNFAVREGRKVARVMLEDVQSGRTGGGK